MKTDRIDLLARTAAFARDVVAPSAPRWEAEMRIGREAIEGTFDVVFLMCVLGTLHGRRTLKRVSTNLAHALRPGGLLVFNELRFHDARVEGSWWARALVEGGLELVKFLDGRDGFRLIFEDTQRGHVIGIYENRPVFSSPAPTGKS